MCVWFLLFFVVSEEWSYFDIHKNITKMSLLTSLCMKLSIEHSTTCDSRTELNYTYNMLLCGLICVSEE